MTVRKLRRLVRSHITFWLSGEFMPRVTIIVAYNEKFVIGNNMGKVPWHIPEDLKFFKEQTMGHPCIMGRTTWESIPEKYKPLPGRLNIVVSRSPERLGLPQGVLQVPSIEDAIGFSEWREDEEIFVTGGAKVYQYSIEHGLVDRVLASEIHNHMDVEGATFFPDLKALGWQGTPFRQYAEFDVIEYTKTKG